MAGKKGQKKRFWSDDEKRSICQQTQVPDVSVAQVARRYAMNANLIHNWLKDPRFSPVNDDDCSRLNDDNFLPIELECAAQEARDLQAAAIPAGAPLGIQRLDLTLSDGRRILLEGATDLVGVLGLIKGLMP